MSSRIIFDGGISLKVDVSSEVNPCWAEVVPNFSGAIPYPFPVSVFSAWSRCSVAKFISDWVVNRPKLILVAVDATSGVNPSAVITWEGSGDPEEHAAPVDMATLRETASTMSSPGIPGTPTFRLPGMRFSMDPNFRNGGDFLLEVS